MTASDVDTGDDIESYGIATGGDGSQFSIVERHRCVDASLRISQLSKMPTDVEVTDPENACG